MGQVAVGQTSQGLKGQGWPRSSETRKQEAWTRGRGTSVRRTRAVPASVPLHFKNKLLTAGRERLRLHQPEDGNRKWEEGERGKRSLRGRGVRPRAHLSEQDLEQQSASEWGLL